MTDVVGINNSVLEYRTLKSLSRYQFRADGEVISLWSTPRPLAGGVDKDGYRKFVLIGDDGKRQYCRRAAMICAAFHGPRPEGMNVRHLDGTRTNDAAINLAWGTQAQNCADKVAHGTAQRGENSGTSKISTAQALQVKAMLSLAPSVIARELGISRNIVYGIKYGKTWAWL